ncbi:MAG: hypothetical protein BWZ04_00234 [Firmicutes bacterium ADurb.BinA205]|nr:MAG: hypothetical protein BWZ04_00234 [Firmicutes bacterium ADurb.BinA205]
MEIKFNIEKSQRKMLAKAIGDSVGAEVKYLGVPSCAYQIGAFTLDKDAMLTYDDTVNTEIINKLLDDLKSAGYSDAHLSDERVETTALETEENSSPCDALTVSMPRDFFTEQALINLRQIISNKKTLLLHALKTDSLEIKETDETIAFPWFTLHNPADADAYIKFISMLCAFAKERKRVIDKPDGRDNEKYAFRCFLLRIGMIGDEFKSARKVLLRNLTGSAAFRHGKKGGEDNESNESSD